MDGIEGAGAGMGAADGGGGAGGPEDAEGGGGNGMESGGDDGIADEREALGGPRLTLDALLLVIREGAELLGWRLGAGRPGLLLFVTGEGFAIRRFAGLSSLWIDCTASSFIIILSAG